MSKMRTEYKFRKKVFGPPKEFEGDREIKSGEYVILLRYKLNPSIFNLIYYDGKRFRMTQDFRTRCNKRTRLTQRYYNLKKDLIVNDVQGYIMMNSHLYGGQTIIKLGLCLSKR